MEDDEPGVFQDMPGSDNDNEQENVMAGSNGDLDSLMMGDAVVMTSIVPTDDHDGSQDLASVAMVDFDLAHLPHEIVVSDSISDEDKLQADSLVKEEMMCHDFVDESGGLHAHHEIEVGSNTIIEASCLGEEEAVVKEELLDEEFDDIGQPKHIPIVTGNDPNVSQQLIIVARPVGDETATQADSAEYVVQRCIRIEAVDGKAYFLAVTDGDVTQIGPEQARPQQVTIPLVSPKEVNKTIRKRSASSSSMTQVASTSSTSIQPPSRNKVTETNGIHQAWFTTRDDKNALHDKGHQWKQGQWTKEEVEVLKDNIDSYCKSHDIKDAAEIIFEMSKDGRKDFYRTIAKGLQRPLFSVYRRVTRMYDLKNHRGKYTPAEIKNLKGLRAQHGNDWAAIGLVLGRSASSVKDKCRLMKDNCNTGKWYPEEENRLAAAVYKLTGLKPSESITTGLSWSSIAEHVVSRSEKQCRTKWLNYLNWKQQGGADWTKNDDNLLVDRVSKLDVNNESEIDWALLAKDWSSVRSPQWLRGKWWSLKRRIPDHSRISFSDLVGCLKKFLSLKPRGLSSQSLKMEVPSQHEMLGVADFHKNSLPISMTSDSEVANLPLPYGPTDDEGYQYEVLQQWSPQVITHDLPDSSPLDSGHATSRPVIIQSFTDMPDSIQTFEEQQVIANDTERCKSDSDEMQKAETSKSLSLSDKITHPGEDPILMSAESEDCDKN